MSSEPIAEPWTRDRLRAELAAVGRSDSPFLFIPGPRQDIDPEGCVVIVQEAGRVRVVVIDRGPQEEVFFADEEAALEHVIRRYVWWQDQ